MVKCKQHKKCQKDAMDKAVEVCKDNNLRFTDLRQYVFNNILAKHQPIKAYDILGNLQKDNNSAKPPTIYRALNFLLESGLIHKLHRLNAYISCSHPQKHNECYFLACIKCGEITECCDENLFKALNKVIKNNNFKARNTTIEIEGICANCSNLS